MSASYRLIAVEKDSYIYECGNCKAKFRTPQKDTVIRATCPVCNHIHVIEPVKKNAGPNLAERVKQFWSGLKKPTYKRRSAIPTWSFYVLLFVVLFLFEWLRRR